MIDVAEPSGQTGGSNIDSTRIGFRQHPNLARFWNEKIMQFSPPKTLTGTELTDLQGFDQGDRSHINGNKLLEVYLEGWEKDAKLHPEDTILLNQRDELKRAVNGIDE